MERRTPLSLAWAKERGVQSDAFLPSPVHPLYTLLGFSAALAPKVSDASLSVCSDLLKKLACSCVGAFELAGQLGSLAGWPAG